MEMWKYIQSAFWWLDISRQQRKSYKVMVHICARFPFQTKRLQQCTKSEILSHLLQIGAITRTTANRIAESLYANDHRELQMAIAEYMDRSISLYDAGAD